MWGIASLGFPPRSKLTLRKVFSASSCSTTPIQAKSFVKINVAICLEQGVADCQMDIYEWLQQQRGSCIKGPHYHRKEITSH